MVTRKSSIVFGLILLLLASLNSGVIFAADEPPILDIPTASVLYTPGNPAVTLAPDLVINPVGTPNLNGASILFGANFSTGDQLVIGGSTNGTSNGITYSYNGTTGVMTLSGTATTDSYQTVLRSVQYQNSQGSPATASRNVGFTLGTQLANPGNGHFYEFVPAPQITWFNADAAADSSSFFGLQGYLTTVTSVSENTFIGSKLTGQGWMGASDDTALTGAPADNWFWVTGPEAGNQFCTAVNFTCPAFGGWYTNWAFEEPNNWGTGETYGHFYVDGEWNDYAPGNTAIAGYVVEYGGMEGDPVLTITDNVIVNYPGSANEAPVIDNQNRSVAENSANGTLVGAALTATDPEMGALTFAITGGSGLGKFAIDNSGQLTVAGALDYEAATSHTLTVQITDSGSLSDSAIITVSITDEDDAPEANVAPVLDALDTQLVVLGENVAFTATASDANVADTLSFSLGAGAPAGAAIDANSGAFTWTPDTYGVYTVQIVVSDNGTPVMNDQGDVTVRVGQEMVTNGEFSAYTKQMPDDWTTTKLVKKQVRVKCSTLTTNCFLRMRKTDSKSRSILTQFADETQVSLLGAGDELVLSARVRTSRAASKVIRVRVIYDDPNLGTNGADVVAFRLPNTDGFQTLVSEPLALKGTVDRLKFRLRYPKKAGKYDLDDISVLVTPSATSTLNAGVMTRDGAMVEVPAAPTELRK